MKPAGARDDLLDHPGFAYQDDVVLTWARPKEPYLLEIALFVSETALFVLEIELLAAGGPPR